MTRLIGAVESGVVTLVWIAVAIAATMMLALIVERIAMAAHDSWLRRVADRYGPLARRALGGDEEATRALSQIPSRYRITVARLVIAPLVGHRDPARIAAARRVVRAMSIVEIADRFLRSPWWWRRVLALRALGLIQAHDRAARIVAALDDSNGDVRGAALDALADLQDPTTLAATVVRLHDGSLDRGRRAAAIAAFGSQCEGFLLDLAAVDPAHRVNYARTLAICGTVAARPTLCEWTGDTRPEVRAAAFEALARVGVDEHAATLAIQALDSEDETVRAMAASALHGWIGPGHAAAHLARHLDDPWPVAVRAARSLQSMHGAGRVELEACAMRPGLAGVLARQMLWEAEVHA
jgi:HEAT repeat protein